MDPVRRGPNAGSPRGVLERLHHMSATSTINDPVASKAFLRLAAVGDQFERYANPHAVRIAAIADGIAKLLHMAAEDCRSLRVAALLHDLGETTMERDYIWRPEALTEEERIDLARHPVIGEQEASRAGASRAAQLLVRWHHEWWNGCGYPDALRGEEIPLAARTGAKTDHRVGGDRVRSAGRKSVSVARPPACQNRGAVATGWSTQR